MEGRAVFCFYSSGEMESISVRSLMISLPSDQIGCHDH